MTEIDRLESFNTAVGRWLKEARLKSGVTSDEAASNMSSTVKDLEDIEAGRVSIVGADFYSLINTYEIPDDEVKVFLEKYGLQASSN